MILKIISAEDVIFEGEVNSVTLPGELGAFTVLCNHASLISTLVAGNIAYELGDGTRDMRAIDGGMVSVDNNLVSVCIF